MSGHCIAPLAVWGRRHLLGVERLGFVVDDLVGLLGLLAARQSRFKWPVLPQLWHCLVSCLLGVGVNRGLLLALLLNGRLDVREILWELRVRVRVLVALRL